MSVLLIPSHTKQKFGTENFNVFSQSEYIATESRDGSLLFCI